MNAPTRYRPGERIGGRYLVHAAKAGGMGEVYLCLDERDNLPYALKTLRDEAFALPEYRAAFDNEIGTWVALEKHPNVVRCHFLDIVDSRPFLFLEWVFGEEGRGADLRDWLVQRERATGIGRLAVGDALGVALDAARALAHAAERVPGLVHRDLKPENVLVAQGPVAKVTDFGLSRLADVIANADKATGVVADARLSRMAGTMAYMAPEQWRGQALDARTDLYAFGCILHELLTGRRPYTQRTVLRLQAAHLEGEIPTLGTAEGVPQALGHIVQRCLQKEKADRYADAASLLVALEGAYRDVLGEEPPAAPVAAQMLAADHSNRGKTYADLGRHDAALADYASALALDPANAKAYNNRGNTYADLGRYDEALADYGRAIALDPADARTYNNRGNTHQVLGRHDAALADYELAIALDPALATACYNRASTRAALGHHDAALADYERAIELDPANADAFLNRGASNHALGHYEDALTDYGRAIALDPTNAAAFYNRGLTCRAIARHDDALADFARAVELNPADPAAFSSRGHTYRALSRHEEALADYERTVALAPTNAGAYHDRGNALHALGRDDEALADYERAMELDPAHADACLNAGVVHANLGREEQALPYLERAAELGHPQGAHYAELVRDALGGGAPLR